MIRTYSELISLPSFLERYRYLKLSDRVCEETFGFDRYLNQRFYRSKEWKDIRNYIITRDLGCDLASEDRPIPQGVKVLIHHINPITKSTIDDESILDPENLITTTKLTHDAIHYGDESILLSDEPIIRIPNDMCPWRL